MKEMGEMRSPLLWMISDGFNTLEKLKSNSNFNPEKLKILDSEIKSLENDKYIKKDNGRLSLTSSGLLLLSKFLSLYDYHLMKYDKRNYFEYKNNTGTDVIFLPYLGFDERENILDFDARKYKFYRTELKLNNIEFNVLQAIENFLSDISLNTIGLFWILKTNSGRNLCGIRIENLLKAINEKDISECEIKLATSEDPYVLIITGKLRNKILENLNMFFYLSNCGEWPYIDVIEYINNKLKHFLSFLGIESIPRGEEIVFQNKKFGSFNSKDPSFFLSILGKTYVKDKNVEIIDFFMPLIISVNPKNIPSPKEIKEVCPWMIQQNGGFTDDILKRKFHLWYVEYWTFPEATIVEVMVDMFSRKLFRLESKFFRPRRHRKLIRHKSKATIKS